MNDTVEVEVRAAVIDALAAAGWVRIVGGTAVAMKTYPTAVGPKVAHAYFYGAGAHDVHHVLQGQYYSEGRNVLEPRSVLIPKDTTSHVVKTLAERFAADADEGVLGSYAARLHRRWSSEPESSELQIEEEGQGPSL